jgi:hypothetical protein
MTTVREEVKRMLREIRDVSEMTGSIATEYLYKLSAWLGNIGEEIVAREKAVIHAKIKIMEENREMPMAKVEALAKNSEDYIGLLEAKQLREAVVETIRALKYRVRSLEDEFQSMK